MTKRTITFEMKFHLGDCLTQVHWMKRSCAIQQEADFKFYCQPEYHRECAIFAGPHLDRIALLPYVDAPEGAMDCWIAPVLTDYIRKWPKLSGVKTMGYLRNYEFDYCDVFMILYQNIADACGLVNPIKSKLDIVFDLPKVAKPKDCPEGPWRYLVINAPSQSNEFDFDPQNWEWLLRQCVARGKTICTHPNKAGVFSTLEHGWSVCDLGSIAHRAENVLAVHTGPLWPCINTKSIKLVKFWMVCTHGHYFAYHDRFHWARNFEAAKLLLARKGII